ncbi:MAG TPA: SRPBCC family protein [Paracoccaceae bacterium]|nr:SRPBCC family protein [Paracoccaceae bacterium]
MTIAPILASVSVAAPPARAFELFTTHIGDWWPKHMSIGAAPPETVVIEPRTGGRWFERAADGTETQWGKVLDWAPPGRLLLAWQIDGQWRYDAGLVTEVELRFDLEGESRTRVTLEHRNLERYGPSAAAHAEQLRGGWPRLLEGYAALAA